MNKVLSVFLLCFSLNFANGQWVLQKELVGVAGTFTADVLGNLYLYDSYHLKKTDVDGKTLFTYANSSLGEITSVDISDPLRLMLFYSDFNYIVFLDNSLSLLRDPVSFDQLSLNRAEVVCASQKGGFWVFDAGDLRLRYFDSNMQKLNESNMIDIGGESDKAISLSEFTDYICLVFEKKGCYVFDKFGNYAFRIQEQGFISPYINNGKLYYVLGNNLVEHDLLLHNEKKISLPVDNYKHIVFNGSSLYVLSGDLLQIYFLVEN